MSLYLCFGLYPFYVGQRTVMVSFKIRLQFVIVLFSSGAKAERVELVNGKF